MTTESTTHWLLDASRKQRIISAGRVLSKLLDSYSHRLAAEAFNLDFHETVVELTPNAVLQASGKEQDQLLSALKQQVRREARTERRTELDIVCDFLVKKTPTSLKVPIKRRGRKRRWDPRAEALFVTGIWKMIGNPQVFGLSGFRNSDDDLRPLIRKAVEYHQARRAPDQSVANLLDRYREAFPRNLYLSILLELIADLCHDTWIHRHEAMCLTGIYFLYLALDPTTPWLPDTQHVVFQELWVRLSSFAGNRSPMSLPELIADMEI